MMSTRAIRFLLFFLLVSAVVFPWCFTLSLDETQPTRKIETQCHMIPTMEDIGPQLDCYIRGVDARIPWDNLTLYFDIVVTGSRPIAQVIFSCRPPGNQSWYNESMPENALKECVYSYAYDFILPDRLDLHVWQVRYFASDSDGYSSATEIVDVALKWQSFPDTPRFIMITSPSDIIYEYGTSGHRLEWQHLSSYQGSYYESPEQYQLWRDGFLVEWLQWPEQGVTVGADGLSLGTHTFQLTAIVGPPWKYTYDDEVTVDVVIGVPGEGSNPSMRYYLREYFDVTYIGNRELPLSILVMDLDGIENVSMMYSSDHEIWHEVMMTPDNDTGGLFVTSLPFENLSSLSRISYSVRYLACDSLGNWAATPLCSYEIQYSLLIGDCPVDLYDTPDLWYLVNTTGHHVTWECAMSGQFYSLYEDSYIIRRGRWRSQLTINVDGLHLGDHTFKIIVDCGGWSDSDTVTVHVVEQLPFGLHQDSVGPLKPASLLLMAGILVGPPVTILALVVLRRRRTKQTT